jgi:hypothetical protein
MVLPAKIFFPQRWLSITSSERIDLLGATENDRAVKTQILWFIHPALFRLIAEIPLCHYLGTLARDN